MKLIKMEKYFMLSPKQRLVPTFMALSLLARAEILLRHYPSGLNRFDDFILKFHLRFEEWGLLCSVFWYFYPFTKRNYICKQNFETIIEPQTGTQFVRWSIEVPPQVLLIKLSILLPSWGTEWASPNGHSPVSQSVPFDWLQSASGFFWVNTTI